MKKYFIPIILALFVLLSVVFYLLHQQVPQISFSVLMAGNGLMAILVLGGYLIVKKQIGSRPQAFVRGVYSSSFLKLFVCMVAILAYVLVDKEHIYRPVLFILFGIYAVYTVFETWALSQMARGASRS